MILNKDHLVRQLDLIPTEKVEQTKVHVIGAGAIGSFLILQLAKMGFTQIQVWDHDEVSVENMSCQFYRFKDIGKNKATALADLVEEFTGIRIMSHPVKWEPDSAEPMPGIVVAAADCMNVRRAVWNFVRRASPSTTLVIDPRMGSEFATLYMMDPGKPADVATYRETFYSNEDAVQERCTAKATVYTANLLSGLIAKGVKNWVCGQPYPRAAHWDIASSDTGSLVM